MQSQEPKQRRPGKRRKPRPEPLLAIDYAAYMRSPAWKRKRAKILATAKNKCAGCGRRARHVHHRTYERLGCEYDQDLVAVCLDCHRDIHLYHVEHAGDMSLWDATNSLIKERREAYRLPPITLPTYYRRGIARRAREERAAAIPVNSPGRVEVRTVTCPNCDAGPGEMCKTGRGNPRPANHLSRVNVWMAQRGVGPRARAS